MRRVGTAPAWDARAQGQQAVVGEPGQGQGAVPSRAWPRTEDGYCEMLGLLIHPTHTPREPCPKARGTAGEGHGFRDPCEGLVPRDILAKTVTLSW